MDMKPQTVEMQEWYEDLTVERANYCGLKVIGLAVAMWGLIGFILWMSGVFN